MRRIIKRGNVVILLRGGKTRINSPPLRLSLAKSYGTICICLARRLISSHPARAHNMLHATFCGSDDRFRNLFSSCCSCSCIGVAFTSCASSASFATFKSTPFGGRILCTYVCVCMYVHAIVRMYYTHECYNIFFFFFNICVFFFFISDLFYFVAVAKFYFTHLARSPFVLNKFVLTSRIFRQNVQLSSCVYAPHMHMDTNIHIHSCRLGPR